MAGPDYHSRTHPPDADDPIAGPWKERALINGWANRGGRTHVVEYRRVYGQQDQADVLEFRGDLVGPWGTAAFVVDEEDRFVSDSYDVAPAWSAGIRLVAHCDLIFDTGEFIISLVDSSIAPVGSAGGALDGSFPNPGLAASVAGAGLTETSDVLSVNVDGSTIEISSDTLRVKDGGITSAKIANGTIVAADIANDTITATQIAADAITSSELADNAVDTNAIQTDAVTAAKIATDAVGSSEIAAGAVTGSELENFGPGATGPLGDGTHVPVITVDAHGRVSALTSAAISATGGMEASKNGTDVTAAPRGRFNFIEGSRVTLAVTDDGSGDKVDITITADASTQANDTQFILAAEVFA